MRLWIILILFIFVVQFSLADIYEDDDTFASATVLAIGETQTHDFDAFSDADYIKFTLSENQTYSLYTVGISSASTSDTVLYIYNATESRLALNDDKGLGTTSSKIDFVAPYSGIFYGRMIEWDGSVGGSYTVTLIQQGVLNTTHILLYPYIKNATTFTFQVNATCVSGACEDITAYLDPSPQAEKELKQNGKVPVIIIDQRTNLRASPLRQASRATSVPNRRFVTQEEFEALDEDPFIEIQYDQRVRALLDQSIPYIGADDFWNQTNYTGENQAICVIDTGVDYTHEDLGSCEATSNINDGSCMKVIGGYDFVNLDNNPMDDEGHGTHVAGIVAGNGSTYRGVAPGAKIVAIKVLDSNGDGYTSDVVSGINWCTTNKDTYNITVITMSLGAGLYPKGCTGFSTQSAIQNAIDNNITVFAAAGNQGEIGLASPACITQTIAVGSTTTSGTVSSFSERIPYLDIFAPGSSIRSANLGGGYITLSGTSMATPHAAGAAALIKDHFSLSSPTYIKLLLQSTGTEIQDSITKITAKQINLTRALTAKGIIPTTNTNPFWTTSSNPQTCSNLQENDVCQLTWTVHTNTSLNTSYEFFIQYVGALYYQESPHQILTVTNDSTPPSTTHNNPTSWQNQSFTITFAATDSGVGVYATYVNDTQTTTYTITQEGNYLLTYYSVDNAGNAETEKNLTILYDATAPNTTYSPTTSIQSSPLNITLTATDILSGINYTSYRVNAGPYTNGTAINQTAEGTYLVEWYSVDIAGNQEATKNFTYVIDTTPPTTTHNAPSSWQNQSVTINFTPIDTVSAIAATYVTVGQNATINATNTTISAQGNHTITYFSQDAVGNNETEKNLTVLIDKTKPVIKNIVSSPLAPAENDSVSFTWAATDIHLENTWFTYNSQIYNQTNNTIQVSTPGTYAIRFYANDSVQNVQSRTYNLVVFEQERQNATITSPTQFTFTQTRTRIRVGTNTSTAINLSTKATTTKPHFVNTSLTNAKRYIEIEPEVNKTIDWYILNVSYTDDEVSGLDESTLVLHRYNQTSDSWDEITSTLSYVSETGRDTTNNYLWANLTRFSLYALAGDDEVVATESSSSSGGGGGGGGSGKSRSSGGGGYAPQTQKENYSTTLSSIKQGQTYTINPLTYQPIDEIRFVASENNAFKRFELLNVSPKFPYVQYTAFRIVLDSKIEDIEVDFFVGKNWVTSHNISPDTVSVYGNANWSMISSERIGSNKTHYLYTAQIPQKGTYVIGYEKYIPEPVLVVDPIVNQTFEIKQNETQQEIVAEEKNDYRPFWFMLLLIVVGAGILYFFKKKAATQ